MKRETADEVVVSVYVANYNYGRYLKQAVDSVLAQTYRHFEVIIIDDGSTDDSRTVIEAFRHDPRVRIIYQENRGLIATANLGVKAARGRYVMRLDADDWLDPNALLVMCHALDADPTVALVFPDYFYVDHAGAITGQERRHDFAQVTLLDQPAHGACSLARRETLLEVGAYSADIDCQDGVDLWLKLVGRYPVRNVNLPLFYYRRHGENLTEQGERILRQRASIFARHASKVEQPSLDVVAVIPVRGPTFDPRDLSLVSLGGKALIDWTVEAAASAKHINRVIVTTPCDRVRTHLAERWGSRVTCVERSPDTARENVSFERVVMQAVERGHTVTPDAVCELTIQFPFREPFYVDKAVDALRIFGADRVVAVVPEDDFIYQHDGSTLVPVGGAARLAGLRLEREYLYRQAGGLLLFRTTPGGTPGRMSHVVVSRRAGFRVRDATDLKMAATFVES